MNRRNAGVLIGDARDRHPLVDRTGEQRREVVPRHLTIGRRDGIAVRVHFRPAQHLVDPLDQSIRDDVLQLLGLVVDLVPAQAHHPDEKQLHQPVTAQHERGQLFARRPEPHAVVGLVLDQPRLRERLHHRGGGAGRHAERQRQLAHGQQALPRPPAALRRGRSPSGSSRRCWTEASWIHQLSKLVGSVLDILRLIVWCNFALLKISALRRP